MYVASLTTCILCCTCTALFQNSGKVGVKLSMVEVLLNRKLKAYEETEISTKSILFVRNAILLKIIAKVSNFGFNLSSKNTMNFVMLFFPSK